MRWLAVALVLTSLAGCTDAGDTVAPEGDLRDGQAAGDVQDPAHADGNDTHQQDVANHTGPQDANETSGHASNATSNATADGSDPADETTPDATSTFEPDVVVAVLDTGIYPDHALFEDRIVAWHDFGVEGDATGLWHDGVGPYDGGQHGTAVASMVLAGPDASKPIDSKIGLAVAKITGASGSAAWSDVARAMAWATDVVGADIITLSFYTYEPVLAPNRALVDALTDARAAGTLPVVLAGNGLANAGLPSFSWLHQPGMSTTSLVVGGADRSGGPVAPMGTMDPEVLAPYYVTVACTDAEDCYKSWQGTSFSTPVVAGYAARAVAVAEAAGHAITVDDLETLIKHTAKDSTAPPTLEGYGLVDQDALAALLQHAAAGTRPALSAEQETNAVYVESVQNGIRGLRE